MRKLVLTLAFAGVALAQGGNPFITLTENGYGFLLFPGGQPLVTRGVLAADPGPGGLPSALTYNLLGPPSLVAGDLHINEIQGVTVVGSDIIRFNPAGTGTPGYPASAIFYSDQDDLPLQLADTGFPTGSYTNIVNLQEIVFPDGSNGVIYTPTASQPGFVPGFSVTYNIISDAPEPSAFALAGIAMLALLAKTRRNAAQKRVD